MSSSAENSSNSSKRRGAAAGGSSSHILRTTSTAGAGNSSPSNSSNANSSSTARPSSSHRNSIIAPPPRVALGGPSSNSNSSSPAPDDHQHHHHGQGGGGGGSSHGGPNGNSGGGPSSTSGGSSSSSSKDTISTASAASAAVAAAAAATQLVKEKDLRIAHLERELAVMEAEFTRELDRLSRNESETASFWQAKHSALNQQFLRADTELRLLRAEVELREAERDELRDGWEAAKREAAEREDEARALRNQVRGLKEWVSTSTRADGQTSDEVFGEGMARLGNGLQNWVIVNFRRSKLDLSKASQAAKDELGRLVPMYEELRHSAKVHLLQSLVSRLLVEMVFDAYFVGLSSEQTQQLSQIEALLSSFAGAAEPVNQWRSLTLTILKKDAAQRLPAGTSRVTEEVVSRANAVLDAITDAPRTETRDQALRALVAGAVELSRMLVAQRAVFRVAMPEVLPHQRVVFDPATMEDIGGEDEDSLAQREIACVTFPGIIKRGDETGGHLQYRNVIAKARVLCAPE